MRTNYPRKPATVANSGGWLLVSDQSMIGPFLSKVEAEEIHAAMTPEFAATFEIVRVPQSEV